jgi:hypothetical protein
LATGGIAGPATEGLIDINTIRAKSEKNKAVRNSGRVLLNPKRTAGLATVQDGWRIRVSRMNGRFMALAWISAAGMICHGQNAPALSFRHVFFLKKFAARNELPPP